MGHGARARDVARLSLPADATHGAPRARRRAARGGQSRRAQRPRRRRTSSAASAARSMRWRSKSRKRKPGCAGTSTNASAQPRHWALRRRRSARAKSSTTRCSMHRSTDSRCGTRTARSSTPIPRCGGCTAIATASFAVAAGHVHRARRYHRDFLRAVAAGESLHSEVTRRAQGWHRRWSSRCTAIPMQYQGEPHVLTIARDITERSARRKSSRGSANRCISARSSRHSVRCWPVCRTSSTIRSRSSSRARCCSRSRAIPPRRPPPSKIRTAAERCARIVRTFLAMARQQQPERGPVAINDVVCAGARHHRLRRSHEQHRTDARPLRGHSADPRRRRPAPPGDAEPDHQRAAVAAGPARAAPDSRAQRIRCGATTCCASSSPTTVPAFRQHLRARVFEPYFTTKPTGVGTGVGLAVSLGIVEAHGGTLTVDCPGRRRRGLHDHAARGRDRAGRRRRHRGAGMRARASARSSSSTTRRTFAKRWPRS